MASILSVAVSLIIMTVLMRFSKDLGEAMFMPDRSSFRDWSQYLSISLPMIIICALVLVAYEINLIFAGHVDIDTVSAQTIVISLFYSF